MTADQSVRMPWEKPPPTYRIVCISVYPADLTRADGLVTRLRECGFTAMNRSALIRAAVAQFDVDKFIHDEEGKRG